MPAAAVRDVAAAVVVELFPFKLVRHGADQVHWMSEIQYSQIEAAWMETRRMKNHTASMLSVVKTGRMTAGPTSPRIEAAMENPISMAVQKFTTHARKKNPSVASSWKPTLQYSHRRNRRRRGAGGGHLHQHPVRGYVPAR